MNKSDKWVFRAAPDGTVDDMWELVGTNLDVQVAGKGLYFVNEWNEAEGWALDHGKFSSLKKAKAKAEALAAKKGSNGRMS
jgi:hypothetical protein